MVKKIISETARLINKKMTERDRICENFGIDSSMGINMNDQRAREAIYTPNKYEGELKRFLYDQNLDDLKAIQTLMYFGRQRYSEELPDLEGTHSYFQARDETKEDIVRTIIEKSPRFSEYVKLAFDYIDLKGIEWKTILYP